MRLRSAAVEDAGAGMDVGGGWKEAASPSQPISARRRRTRAEGSHAVEAGNEMRRKRTWKRGRRQARFIVARER